MELQLALQLHTQCVGGAGQDESDCQLLKNVTRILIAALGTTFLD